MEDILKTLKKKEHIDLINKIFTSKQEHVLEFWHELDEIKREHHLNRLSQVDFELLARLIEDNIENISVDKKGREIAPPDVIPIPKTDQEIALLKEATRVGEEAISRGEVAIFLVAGGQGSRLGFEGPKGMFPITPIKHKTLFHLFAEKIRGLNRRYGVSLPWFIMTSEENDETTKKYFADNTYLGLSKKNTFIFRQGMIPAIDAQGKLILKEKHEIFLNPNGHGGSILALHLSGSLTEMKKRGVKYIFYFQVDNPLVIMADPAFLGYHLLNSADMSGKAVQKTGPEERVGVYGYVNGRMGVIEYSDLTKEEMFSTDAKGNLLYNAGNTAIHIISLDFLERLVKEGHRLPYHVARKKIETHKGEVDGIKFETFIFDAFAEARHYALMDVRREENFAPVKNKEGVDSPATSAEMQVSLFGSWLEAAGISVPKKDGKVDGLIEISPLFALTKEQFLEKYREKPVLKSGFSLYIG